MNKYNRRSRPNLRHNVEFWSPSTEAGASGELEQKFILEYKGPFSLELPRNPVEVADSGKIQNEQVFVLIGQWCKDALRVTAGMYAVIPSFQKVYAIQGNATDPWGDRRKVHIRIVDNVTQPVTVQIINTMF
jgi:hypothetical protein